MQSYRELELQRFPDGASTGAWWEPSATGERIDCLLCPRKCSLKPGDRGFCFVRENRDGEMALATYGRSTGFCIDPIEKKPLNHFYPGTPVLSFGTAGCNLGCKFCQNWDISKSREVDRLSSLAEPDVIARAAQELGCKSVAYTYNDPVIWAEYAIDTAKACHAVGVKNVAVTAGYISPAARSEFFEFMDAANVDLKAFTEEFYEKITYSHLQPVLETLEYLKNETQVWFELTNLIIPDANDNPDDLRKMCGWILKSIGDEVPIHFTAFHPDFRMTDRGRTAPETLIMAQEIARGEGIKYAYIGNVHNLERQSTYCPGCGQLLVQRDWYQLGIYNIAEHGNCNDCGVRIPGRFEDQCGTWGAKRQPVQIDAFRRPEPQLPVTELPNTQTPDANFSNAVSASPGSTSAAAQSTPTNHGANHNSTKLVSIQTPETQSQETPMTSNAPTPKTTSTGPVTAPTPSRPTLLNLDRITKEQQQNLIQSAATWLSDVVLGRTPKTAADALGELSDAIVMGAFVTAKRGEVLRGCCGVLGKPMALGGAVAAAAAKTAKEDNRMAAISPNELPYLNLDLTLLGPFKKIEASGSARAEAIEIGKHGLMIQRGDRSGLLLPSVATERNWTPLQFLQGVCSKANLPIGAWESDETTVFTFDGKSFSAPAAELLPGDLPMSVPSPLSKEELAEYAKVAGHNIVALVTGGTPSYVVPGLSDATVNAIVLSMQWGSGDEGSDDTRQGNSLNVSFRPGVPLQSTLYQMCQRAAAMFQQQRFAGQLQIGITIGYDPSMHGYGLQADLSGVDAANRGIVISDARHCGFAYHPEKSIDVLRDTLRQSLPISSRDASVHTMAVTSTMPHVVSVSQPVAAKASGIRPPAVAGRFYPAEDAARRAMVGTLFKSEDPPQSTPLAIMVPHAGIKYSGKVAAKAWRSVENLDSRTIIVISPKHTANGVNWSACPYDTWRLSDTTSIASDAELASQIAEAVTPIELDSAAHQQEHGIEVQLPILERLAPNSKVVGLALNGGSWEDIQAAAAEFATFLSTLPEMPLLVISSDMNHYAPEAENRRRDRLALDALVAGDPKQLIDTCQANEISMCGLVPAAFVMETLRRMDKDFNAQELDYTTSAEVSGDKSQVVGYAAALLQGV